MAPVDILIRVYLTAEEDGYVAGIITVLVSLRHVSHTIKKIGRPFGRQRHFRHANVPTVFYYFCRPPVKRY
jgi:hypothetical protein